MTENLTKLSGNKHTTHATTTHKYLCFIYLYKYMYFYKYILKIIILEFGVKSYRQNLLAKAKGE